MIATKTKLNKQGLKAFARGILLYLPTALVTEAPQIVTNCDRE